MELRLNRAAKDLDAVTAGPNFNQIKNSSILLNPWQEAKALALRWIDKAKPRLSDIEDATLQPLEAFAARLVDIGNGGGRGQNEDIRTAISRAQIDFLGKIPLLTYELLESSGIFQLSNNALRNWRQETADEVHKAAKEAEDRIKTAIAEADSNLKSAAVEAGRDFELAKQKSQKILLDSAEIQFQAADKSFRAKKNIWGAVTAVFFIALILALAWLLKNPLELITDVMNAMKPGSVSRPLPVSIPLLLAASAYLTTLRLALIGVLGIGFAFSLRMARAYLHLVEHNAHKLRVTRSIEAFVAAIRGDERKDLVLGKLVESVTEFGDTGILGQEEKPSGLPSVIFESLTKNVGRTE
jgi:hypothetical protein